MAKHFPKLSAFPAFAAQPLWVDKHRRPHAAVHLVKPRHLDYYSKLFGHSEFLVGLGMTLALHTAWILHMPATAQQTTLQPPKPISVQWLISPRVHTEPTKQPAPPKPSPKQAKPAVKPKLQPPKTVTKPLQPLIKSTQKAIEPISPAPKTATQTLPVSPAAAIVPTAPTPPTPAKASVADTTPVTLPHLNADYLDNPAPHYPPASRELGEQGRVLVRAMVSADGRVAQVALRKSSGFDRLDQAALDSVKHWRFVPAQRGGQPVTAWVVVPVAFSIEG